MCQGRIEEFLASIQRELPFPSWIGIGCRWARGGAINTDSFLRQSSGKVSWRAGGGSDISSLPLLAAQGAPRMAPTRGVGV